MGERVSEIVKLKTLREECGKTRKEAADALGVTVQSIARYENGDRQLALNQIFPLASLYGVSTEEIIIAALKRNKDAQ